LKRLYGQGYVPHLLHKKTILISVVVFGIFLIVTQPLYRFLMPVTQLNEITSKPAFQIYKALTGGSHPTRTLLVFANNAEQRIGGGFVGSVGILNGAHNQLQIESVRSIYYYDHRLEEKGAFLGAPEYLQNLTAKIYARDSLLTTSNSENSQKFRDLYARETGEYIDNVVIITPKALSLLIKYIGPIDLPSYNLTITSDNILTTLQQEVESGQDKADGRDPKAILKVLAEQLVIRVPNLTSLQLTQLSDDIIGLMQTQQMYVYLQDHSVMEKLSMYQEPIAQAGDPNTLNIVVANHAANKSSQAIEQEVQVTMHIAQDGMARLSAQISHMHTSDYTGYYIDPKTGQGNFLIGDDLSWIQLTLPRDTKMITEGPMKAQKEPGVFGVDVSTKPLTTSKVTAEFVLPTRYAMLEQIVIDETFLAQFGWLGQKVQFRVEVPENYRFMYGSDGVQGNSNIASRSFFQIDDEKMRFVFSKQ
jgi:hypothetical protein